ncbi:MAG: hypothetical protein ACI9PY_001085 [Ascidiaceihabitans sp.]|jgi:hypothetical protein
MNRLTMVRNMPKPKEIKKNEASDFVNDNLKMVFQELSDDKLPDEIGDLLRVLKAQDEAAEAKK